MDISNSSSTNSSDLDTMGNILTSSNENNSQVSETDQSTNITHEESILTNQNIEVNEPLDENIAASSIDDAKDELESFTDNLTTQDIDLIIMGKRSGDSLKSDPIPQTSGTADNLNISESDDNVEDLWLEGDTRELVKVDNDEDFEVIVKSLETAIVETERYDIESVIAADKEPILSPTLVSTSIVDPDCETDPVVSSDSLFDDISKELVPSPLITPSLAEMAEHGEEVMLSDNVGITDDITKELEVEALKLRTEDTDTQDQCLENLIDTSIITNEFSTITDDIQGTFDDQSSSLFDTTDSVTDIAVSIGNQPSLLELQEADMVCDISEEINKEMDKDILPLIKDTVFENSVDSTEEMLNNIVSKSLENEVMPELIESQINEATDKEVDNVLLEFPETESASLKDENSDEETLDELVGTSTDFEGTPAQDIDEKYEDIEEKSDEEIENKSVEKLGRKSFEENSETSTELTKEAQIVVQTDDRSDVGTPDNIISETSLDNIADEDIFHKNETSDSSTTEDVISTTLNLSEEIITKIDEPESTQQDVALSTSADIVKNINETSLKENNIKLEIKTEEKVSGFDEDEIESEVKEILEETPTILSSKNIGQLEAKSDNLIEEVNAEVEPEYSDHSEEEITESSDILEENLPKSSVKTDDPLIEPTIPEEVVDKSPVIPEESVVQSLSILDENVVKSPNVLEETIAKSPVILEENQTQSSVILEESTAKSPILLEESTTQSSVILEESTTQSPVILEKNTAQTPIILEENIATSAVTLEESTIQVPVSAEQTVTKETVTRKENEDKSALVIEQTVDDSSNTAEVDSTKMTSIEEHIVKSASVTQKPKSFVVIDSLISEVEKKSSNQTSSSSHEIQRAKTEDEIKSRKHSLQMDEKEQSPPKKIKLVREKLYPPPEKTREISVSSIVAGETIKDIVQKREDLPESKNIKIENKEISIEKPTIEMCATTSKVAAEEVCEKKIIIEGKKLSSPVKIQKLKLKRNYEPPKVKMNRLAEVFETRKIVNNPEKTVTEDKEMIVEKTIETSTNIYKEETVQIKTPISDVDIDDSKVRKTPLYASNKIEDIIPVVEESVTKHEDLKLVASPKPLHITEQMETEQSVSKEEKIIQEDAEYKLDTEKHNVSELDSEIKLQNDMQPMNKPESTKDTEINSETIKAINDDKVKDVLPLIQQTSENIKLIVSTTTQKIDEDSSDQSENIDFPVPESAKQDKQVTGIPMKLRTEVVVDELSTALDSSLPTTTDITVTDTEEMSVADSKEITSVKPKKIFGGSSEESNVPIPSNITLAKAESTPLAVPEEQASTSSQTDKSSVNLEEMLSLVPEKNTLVVSEEMVLLSPEINTSPDSKQIKSVAIEEVKQAVKELEKIKSATIDEAEQIKSVAIKEPILVKDKDIVPSQEEVSEKTESIRLGEQRVREDDNKVEKQTEPMSIETEYTVKENENDADKDVDESIQVVKEVERRGEQFPKTIAGKEDEEMKESQEIETRMEQPEEKNEEDEEAIVQVDKEVETRIERPEETIEENEDAIMQAAKDVETRIDQPEESIIEENDDAIMQAAKDVETRINQAGESIEQNDDAIMQAAKEVETRINQAGDRIEEDMQDEDEFSDTSIGICEDEIIAVTQALEMERAAFNKAEKLYKALTESVRTVDKILPRCISQSSVTQDKLLLVTSIDKQQKIASSQEISVTPVEGNVPSPRTLDLKVKAFKDVKAEKQIDKHITTSENIPDNDEENVRMTMTKITKKMKISPLVDNPMKFDTRITSQDSIEKNILRDNPHTSAIQTITIEPVPAPVENVGKLRISRRKPEVLEPILAKSATITKPLRVEVEDLGSSSISPYYSDIPGQRDTENVPKIVIKPIPKPEERSSPKITIKPIVKPPEMVLSPKTKMSKSSDDSCTPRITIKPILKPDPLKITITKQKTDDTHSILKIYRPDDNQMQFEDHHVPKLTIKPIPKGDEMQHSPRITIKPVKPPSQHSPSTSISPKITVKPILPPSDQHVEIIHSPKITVKPVVNPEESYPKVTIKPILRPDDPQRAQLSPRQIKLKSMTFESSSGITVEPISMNLHSPSMQNLESQLTPLKISVKPFAKMDDTLSPKLTIKPITKTCEIVQSEDGSSNPLKLTIKPILKPEESYQSPKITIKPIMKPDELEQTGEDAEKPERIILKIQKTNLPSPKERPSPKESKKEPEVKIEPIPQDSDRNQKLDKIKLKLTKEGSHAQIIPSVPSMMSEQFSLKRPLLFSEPGTSEKRSKCDFSGTEILHTSDISINLVEPNAKPNPKTISEEVTIVKLDRSSTSGATPLAEHISQSKFKEMLLKIQQKADITCTPHIGHDGNSSSSDDVKIVGVGIISKDPIKDPLSIHDESSSQDVVIINEVINTNPFHGVQILNPHTIVEPSIQQTPKKRGRPRKNPLEVKPEIKGEDCVEVVRPKRTCRAPPGRTPFAVKERKPRGAGRARGGGRGRGGARSPPKTPKEPKTLRGKALKEAKALAKLEAAKLAQEVVIDEITIEDSTNDTPVATPVPPVEDTPKKLTDVKESDVQMVDTEVKITQISEELLKQPQPPPVAVYEEETRMSADNNNSRAQTPARQVVIQPALEGPEESQSSVQSSATTESNKNKKGRLEVSDHDSAVTGVEQIVEYSWGGGGTYMLQEQIAQFLGVKSFKRKYPGLTRRPVEMQERDYIREKGLVSESMCDMGLTAVPSSEILDIMYTDFQEKYEEYRKYMRDKQSKEISNKQKAISLATSQEKNKLDFKERAIRSAANWNVNFNKARKESRRCCMDLQTFTINFPVGKTQSKVPQKNPVGHYPIALVPGQFTDYFKPYTSNELHYLPLNTVRYGPVMPNQHCDDGGQSDGSQSDSDSSSGSDSDSSDDSMSTVEDAPPTTFGKPGINLTPMSTPKARVH